MQNENFIYVKDDVLTEETCQDIIKGFLYIDSFNDERTVDRGHMPSTKIQDTRCDIGSLRHVYMDAYRSLCSRDLTYLLQIEVNRCLEEYIQKYEVGMFSAVNSNQPRPTCLEEYPIALTGAQLQRTRPSQGFHVWHAESSCLSHKSRAISYILYLNDISDGGETEFLHLSERVSPKAGRMLIFPAGWTHTHRGNPPLVEDKYIATGWMEYSV